MYSGCSSLPIYGYTSCCETSTTRACASSCSTSHSCNTIDHHREFLSYTLFFSLLLQPMCLFELHNELSRTDIAAKCFFHHFERDSLSCCHFMSIDGVFECSAALCRHGHFEPCYQMVLQRHRLPILRLFCCHSYFCMLSLRRSRTTTTSEPVPNKPPLPESGRCKCPLLTWMA